MTPIYFLEYLVIFSLLSFQESDATWSSWGEWSSCTTTCGFGVKTRERTCDESSCLGPSEMHIACQQSECTNVDDITWSMWGEWSSCSRTCGGGNRTRERTCSSGNVMDCCGHTDIESCTREHVQSRECVNDDCYGTWSDWRQWGDCSVRCGEGVQSRLRECEPTGSVCLGGRDQNRVCYVQCPTSDNILGGSDETVSCDVDNPCQNNGVCDNAGDHVQCTCRGDWRGADCTSMCLNPVFSDSCSNKQGMFHDCTDCSKFVICSRGRVVSIPCVLGRIWTGSGCKLPEETNTVCLE